MTNKRYDKEYKVQEVKLIKEIGMPKASKELGVSLKLSKKTLHKLFA